MIEQAIGRLLFLGPAVLVALFLSLELLVLLRPYLARLAPAEPNPRSSHHVPTPQGGGLAVMVATLAVGWGAIALLPGLARDEASQFLAVSMAAALLMLVGGLDDMRPLPVATRLAGQCVAAGAVIATLPSELQILPQLPWLLERALLLVAAVWFVNLVNFMDGIDWMTVAEVVPLSGALIVLGPETLGWLPALVAAALLGAILGFAPFNKPVAQLFLGDVGSLPIGLLLGWLLLQLGAQGHLAAAIILPLYYLADATLTLARRAIRGEPLWQAHRTHFYQRATDMGFTVPEIVARVFAVNLALAALALASVAAQDPVVSLLALAAAGTIVGWLLWIFAQKKR
jgi:UDP-N-acetylmuramyl pentapeptide phosphotransferase/UDP-N-acetylglucosamine-1-phosphate transferase